MPSVRLPGASELFRPTQAAPAPAPAEPVEPSDAEAATGRVRHDEKITVYVSSEELLALEQLRLQLRARYGIGVDRGRLVREAIGIAIRDVAERESDAELVARLTQP